MLFAIALQAAAPWLAQAAAQAQGKSLVEVCSVYGVRMVALDDGGNPLPASASHAPDCALLALPMLAAGPQDSATASLLPRLDPHGTLAGAPQARTADGLTFATAPPCAVPHRRSVSRGPRLRVQLLGPHAMNTFCPARRHAVALSTLYALAACSAALAQPRTEDPIAAADRIVITGSKTVDSFGEKSGVPLSRMAQSVQLIDADGALHGVALLPPGFADQPLVQRLREAGFAPEALSSMCLERPRRQGLVIGHGSPSMGELKRLGPRLVREIALGLREPR
jgi:hypothetical protein